MQLDQVNNEDRIGLGYSCVMGQTHGGGKSLLMMLKNTTACCCELG